MIADELARGRDACDALHSDDPLRPEMRSLLDTIEKRLEGNEKASRGRRPALPDRWRFLTKLAAHHRLRPSHENAYEVMDALLELCWPSGGQTSTQRSRRILSGGSGGGVLPVTLYRMREQERDTQHKRALRSQAGSAGPSLVTADGLGGLGRFGILPDELM